MYTLDFCKKHVGVFYTFLFLLYSYHVPGI